jgi:REP element-mobilizing transposase RayT
VDAQDDRLHLLVDYPPNAAASALVSQLKGSGQ